MTEFGSFDNSTCKRVLDLLEPGDLTLGQVVIKRYDCKGITVGSFVTVTQVQIIVATHNKTYCRHVTSAYTAVCHGQQTA